MKLVTERIEVSGVSIEVRKGGDGPPLLFLHGGQGLYGHEACLEILCDSFSVVAPVLPGFGQSDLPRTYNSVGDLAYFGLDLLVELDLRDVTLVGACFGGWVAAEMAIRSTERLKRLILIDALGVKFGDHLTRDITDIHAMVEQDVAAALYADPARARRDMTTLSDDALTAIVRDREAFTLFGWKPYMHNPGLAHWLRRVDLPTLVLWGEQDGMVTPDYGRKYADAIPGASFETIADAGHYPTLEQPAAAAERITAFAGGA